MQDEWYVIEDSGRRRLVILGLAAAAAAVTA